MSRRALSFSLWTRRHRERAKLFGLNRRRAWKIEKGEIDDLVKKMVIEYCKLKHSLKTTSTHRERATLLHSRLRTRTRRNMRILPLPHHDSSESGKLHCMRERTASGHVQSVQSKPSENRRLTSCSSSMTPISLSDSTSPFTSCSSIAPTSSVSSAGIPNPWKKDKYSMSTPSWTRNTRPPLQGTPSASSTSSEDILQDRLFQKPSSLDSVFFGSLSSQSRSKQMSKSVLPRPKMKKNRPGQRERRLQAKNLYGSGANHLKKELPRKPAANGRHYHKTSTHGKMHGREVKGHHGGKLPSKPLQRSKTTPLTPNKCASRESIEELHPSWLASKRRKESLMETMSSKPQGQRTVFKDSDED